MQRLASSVRAGIGPFAVAGAQLSPNGVFVMLFGNQAADDVTTPPPHI